MFRLGDIVDRKNGKHMGGKVIFVYQTPNRYKVEWPSVLGSAFSTDEDGVELVLNVGTNRVSQQAQNAAPNPGGYKFKVGDLVNHTGSASLVNGKVLAVSSVWGAVFYDVEWPLNRGAKYNYSEADLLLSTNSVPMGFTHGYTTVTLPTAPTPGRYYTMVGGGGGAMGSAGVTGEKLATPETISKVICECGTKAAVGQSHSYWCKLFRQEF